MASLFGERKSGMYLWVLAFCGLPQWLVSISADSKHWPNWRILVPRSHRVRESAQWRLRCQWTCSITDRHQREQETSFWKRKRQSFSNREKTHTKPKKTHPHKKFERPPESLAGLIIDYLFRTKPARKYWERWLLFQVHKSQQKVTKHMSKQGSMAYVTQIKGTEYISLNWF